VVMSQPSLAKFQNQVSRGARCSTTPPGHRDIPRGDIELLGVPATRMAEEMGNPEEPTCHAGGRSSRRPIWSPWTPVFETLKETFKTKTKLIATNKKALMAGMISPCPGDRERLPPAARRAEAQRL